MRQGTVPALNTGGIRIPSFVFAKLAVIPREFNAARYGSCGETRNRPCGCKPALKVLSMHLQRKENKIYLNSVDTYWAAKVYYPYVTDRSVILPIVR